MSHENVDVCRSWVDGYNRRDVENLIELTHPDCDFRSRFVALESGFRGYEVFYFERDRALADPEAARHCAGDVAGPIR